MRKISILATLLVLALAFSVIPTAVLAAEGATLAEFDCSVLPEEVKDKDKDAPQAPFELQGNDYPNVYIADNKIDANVPAGQIYLGGDASAKEAYCQFIVNFPEPEMIDVRIEMDLKIESLMSPNRSHGWRGFVVECNMEGRPCLYFVVHPLETADADGNNALLSVSQKSRANMDVQQNIKIDVTKFQKWVVEFDKKNTAKFYIDGEEVLTVESIGAGNTKEGASLTIKNVMINVGSGKNSIYIDNIKVIDPHGTPAETTAAPVETTAAPVETTAAPVETTAAPVETTAAPVETTAAPVETTAATTVAAPTEAPATFDAAIVAAVVMAASAGAFVISKRKH